MANEKKRAKHEGMTVTTISLPDDLFRRLKIRALDERRAFVELVRQALFEWLNFQESGRVILRNKLKPKEK